MSQSPPPEKPNRSYTSDAGAPADLIWARPAKERRERPTREKIVTAAIELADSEGLDVVSIRRVAAALGTRPMSLYSFIDRKEDLLDLMVDEVLADAVLNEVPEDWRQALAAIAHALRAVCVAHPWTLAAAGSRLLLGPNVMRHIEQGLGATASLDTGWSQRLAMLRIVDTYALGYGQLGSGRRIQSLQARVADPARRTPIQSYLQALLDTGTFPNLAEVGAESFVRDADEGPTFETGLDWLLTGIAVQLGLPAHRPPGSSGGRARRRPHS